MNNIFKYLSVFFLICFSFFYTDKVLMVINNSDPLMDIIVDLKDEYNVSPVSALIDDDSIIPGVSGREVDVYESYENMKYGGVFREEMLAFDNIYPSESLYNNKNKYIISGNTALKKVAILTIFNNDLINTINKTHHNITVFINHDDLSVKNIKSVKNNEIYTYGNNGVYDKDIIINDNTLINRVSNNNSIYCLVKEKDDDILNICSDNDMFVVLPNIIGDYYDIKNNLTNGSIILLNNLNNIDVIIKFIEGKGYDIVSLSELLSE